MMYSNQSSRRTVFISYRVQIIFVPVSCRCKANLVFFHTVFISHRHRVNGVLIAQTCCLNINKRKTKDLCTARAGLNLNAAHYRLSIKTISRSTMVSCLNYYIIMGLTRVYVMALLSSPSLTSVLQFLLSTKRGLFVITIA